MATIALQPVFQRLSPDEKNAYDLFLQYTNYSNLQTYAKGASLGGLTALAEKAYGAVSKANPIMQEGSPQITVIPGRQWELDQLSHIKEQLAKAIDCKREYYNNHIFGIITKYVLKLFGKWNEGNTAAIICAEDFLIAYDTRFSLMKDAAGNYKAKMFFPLTPASWVRENLNISSFYNYNPRRPVAVHQEFRYDALDPRNPQVFIKG